MALRGLGATGRAPEDVRRLPLGEGGDHTRCDVGVLHKGGYAVGKGEVEWIDWHFARGVEDGHVASRVFVLLVGEGRLREDAVGLAEVAHGHSHHHALGNGDSS